MSDTSPRPDETPADPAATADRSTADSPTPDSTSDAIGADSPASPTPPPPAPTEAPAVAEPVAAAAQPYPAPQPYPTQVPPPPGYAQQPPPGYAQQPPPAYSPQQAPLSPADERTWGMLSHVIGGVHHSPLFALTAPMMWTTTAQMKTAMRIGMPMIAPMRVIVSSQPTRNPIAAVICTLSEFALWARTNGPRSRYMR